MKTIPPRINEEIINQPAAHSVIARCAITDFAYPYTDDPLPQDNACLWWNDPVISLDLPVTNPARSEKNKKELSLRELLSCAYC